MHKSSTHPLCRYCGEPVKKRTKSIWFRERRPNTTYGLFETEFSHTEVVDERPLNRAEAQRYSNFPIVSVSYERPLSSAPDDKPRRVASVTVWDGESYDDAYFCKGACATAFAYLFAKLGRQTTAHEEARKVLDERLKTTARDDRQKERDTDATHYAKLASAAETQDEANEVMQHAAKLDD
jgi:hypothetical protein